MPKIRTVHFSINQKRQVMHDIFKDAGFDTSLEIHYEIEELCLSIATLTETFTFEMLDTLVKAVKAISKGER